MKVIVLAGCYPTRTAPQAGAFTRRQVRALAELGVTCRVVQPVEGAPPPPFHLLHREWRAARSARRGLLAEVDGVPVSQAAVVGRKPSRFFPRDWWEACGRAFARHVRTRRDLRDADVVLAQFLCHEGFAAVVARGTLGMPVAASILGDDVHAWPRRWPDRVGKIRRVLAQADALVACSRALARDAAAWAAPGWDRPIDVVYMGVDPAAFRPAAAGERGEARRALRLADAGRLLLCVGAPLEAKGWRDLFDAFAAVEAHRRGWRILSVAPRRDATDLDLALEAHRRGLDDAVVDLGAVPPEAMPPVYRAADAFVLASHDEGLSNSLVEALASGLPAIATDVGGHAEVVRTGQDGILVPPRRPADLAEAIEYVIGDADRAAALAARAPAAARRVGTVRENALRLRGVLERAAAGGVRAGRA